MDSLITHIEQLLSGMLDGALSEAESVELNAEMAKDPSLEAHLESLRVSRRALGSGISAKALRPDFAKSVTVAAKKRALEMGDNAPVWLVSSDSAEPIQKAVSAQKTALPSITESTQRRRWLYAGGLSLAATVLFLVFSLPKSERQAIVSLPKVSAPESGVFAPVDEKTTANVSEFGVTDPETSKLLEPKPTELLAQSEIQSTTPAQSKGMPSLPSSNVTESVAVLTPTTEAVPLPEPKSTSPSSPKKKQNVTYTMLVDFSIAPRALEEKALEKILEKYGIVYSDELVLNDDQLKILEESNYVGNMEKTKKLLEPFKIDENRIPTIAQKQNAEEKMGVMFLRSTAKTLGMAMTEIFQSVDLFPDCALEISTDNSARQLVAQLSSIQVAESAVGIAKRLSFEGAKGNSPFASSATRGKSMSPASRAKFKAPNLASPNQAQDQAELSNALFLLRPIKK